MLGLSGVEVILDDLGLSCSGTSHEEDGLLALEMHVEKVSETSGMDGGHEDLAENGLISVLVVWNFSCPAAPLVLLNVPVVVKADSSLRELNLDQRLEDAVELADDLVVILTSSYTASIGPHGSKDEKGFIDIFLVLFLFLGAIKADDVFILLNEETIEDHADGVDETHGCWGSQVGYLGLVLHV